MIDLVKKYLIELQQSNCSEVELIEGGAKFAQDSWTRDDKRGSGLTNILTNGNIFEKGGINYSIITGDKMPKSATALRPELEGRKYTALGVSLVLHPENPFIPTAHANVRFFIAEEQGKNPIWWFGGGFDLSPYYGFVEDAVHWHRIASQACETLGEDSYSEYKQWCDDYFYIKHRAETRGVGGLFFDDLYEPDFKRSFAFMRSVGDHFLPAYEPIVERRRHLPYNNSHRDFQLYRRGRYVEFNLVYDRGTLFGLQSGGRTESILMSLPPEVRWRYNWQPAVGSEEQRLYDVFLKPQDWLNYKED